MAHTSNFLVETLFSGHVRIVTPTADVYLSVGRPDAEKVQEYLDRGYHPSRSAKWVFAGKANADDIAYLSRAGCENCDGEGMHDPTVPCSGSECHHGLLSHESANVWRCIECRQVVVG